MLPLERYHNDLGESEIDFKKKKKKEKSENVSVSRVSGNWHALIYRRKKK